MLDMAMRGARVWSSLPRETFSSQGSELKTGGTRQFLSSMLSFDSVEDIYTTEASVKADGKATAILIEGH